MKNINNNQNVIPDVKAKITWLNDDHTAPKKAAANITIADAFTVRGVGIMSGSKGLFVSMPQRVSGKDNDKKYIDVAHPVTAEMRAAINEAVLSAYEQAVGATEEADEEAELTDEEESVPIMGMTM